MKLSLPHQAAAFVVILAFSTEAPAQQPEQTTRAMVTAAAAGDLASLRKHLPPVGNADPNARHPESGITALMAASLYGRTEVARLLLSKRGNPNLVDSNGSSSLHMAAFFGHPEIVRLLLEKGAELDIRNRYGETPFDAVSKQWNDEIRGTYESFAEALKAEIDLDRLQVDRPEVAAILSRHERDGAAHRFNTLVPRRPIDSSSNHYWRHPVNRDRLYDYYAKQALYFGSFPAEKRPEILPQFPGLDRKTNSHFGNQSDREWRDGRANTMDFGSMISGTFRGAERVLPRAVCVDLGEEINAVYNPETQRFVVAWKGRLVNWSDVRRGMQNGLYIGSDDLVELENGPILPEATFLGIYRNGSRVVFAYEHGGKRIYKTAVVEKGKVVEKFLDEEEATRAGESRWPQRLKRKGTLGSHQPYAIDNLEMPYKNPWNSLMFLGGLDFVSEKRIAVSTLFGDVWLCDISDDKLTSLSWKRFAAGLYQPLGLKIIDGVIHAMCRDQIVALHDHNGDDEADFYECVSNLHHTPTGGHSYITGLQRDEKGALYFASAEQGVCRLSPDRKDLNVLATGLRFPNGIAANPAGDVVLASLQEGNWTPASAIVDIVEGGHYGFGGPKDGPLGYIPPMVFLPRGEDSCSGGEEFIDSDLWGPVEGNWIHFSGAMARHFLVLREEIEGGDLNGRRSQGAVIPLWGEFLSGSHRGRMSPYDGQLYVAGAQGYLNYGTRDGSLQRVRFTGGPFHYPTGYETRQNGILLTFSEPQSKELARSGLWFAQQWNYRLSPDYGSDEYSANHPGRSGHDPVAIRSAHWLDGGRKLFLEIPQLQPVNQLHLYYRGSRGNSERLEVFATINRLGKPFVEFPGYEPVTKSGTTSLEIQPAAATIKACITCHHPTEKIVGPPLSEIRERYAGNPEGIVRWAVAPENKTPDTPPMPSFKFIGEEQLLKIAREMLAAPN